MPFEDALRRVKRGVGIRLPHWESDVAIWVQYPDAGSANNMPYLYRQSKNGRVPWIATFAELFEDNWEVVSW